MSLNTYAAPLALEITASVPFALLLVCVHVGAVAVLVMLPVAQELIAVLAFLAAAHALYATRRHALLRDAKSVVKVLWDTQDEWTLTRRDGTTCSARLLPGSYRHPLLTVLNFKVSTWRRRSVIIFPQRVNAESFRQLRVRMLLVSSSPE